MSEHAMRQALFDDLMRVEHDLIAVRNNFALESQLSEPLRLPRAACEKAATAVFEGHKADEQQEDAEAASDRMAATLTAVANALKGPPPALTAHSWHDLPEVAAKLVATGKSTAPAPAFPYLLERDKQKARAAALQAREKD